MQRISDALELLTAQHEEIAALLSSIAEMDNPVGRNQAITELADRITVHLAAEQELLYPAIAANLSRDAHGELMSEHGEIKRLLADLLWLDHDDPRLPQQLTAMQILFAKHAGRQENDLFEAVAQTRSVDELSVLGAEIRGWIDGLVVSDDAIELSPRAVAA